MSIELRKEKQEDYRTVEVLTREAFWNVYVPGCNEHYFLHQLRNTDSFIPKLSYVAVLDGEIVGHIAYMESKASDVSTITFGPVSVLPEKQGDMIGSKLIKETLNLAREYEYNAVIIYGDPEYYKRFGFVAAKEFGITDSEGKFPMAMQALELQNDGLKNAKGEFKLLFEYNPDITVVEEFDKSFPHKEKITGTQSQERFQSVSTTYL